MPAAIRHRPLETVEKLVKRPRFIVEHVKLLARLRHVRGQRHRELRRAFSRQPVKRRRRRVRRVRTQSEKIQRTRPRREKTQRPRQRPLRRQPMPDVDHLVKPPSPQRRRRQPQHQFRKRLNIPNRRRPPLLRLRKPLPNRRQIVVIIQAALQGIDPPHPSRKTLRRINRMPHHRVVEMTMRIDQPRQQNHLAQIRHLAGMPRHDFRRITNCHDAIPFDHNRAVFDRRAFDGQNSACVENHSDKSVVSRVLR